MKVLIIGGVAGGATAAARARRLSESAEITVVERGPYVSYANCGLPYFISKDITKRSKLLLQTPEGFDRRYCVKVLVETEALEIDRAGKRVRVRGPEGESWLAYDSLILAQGGSPLMPPVPGIDSPNVFRLWTVPDMDRIMDFLEKEAPATAVIAGGGFIGMEMAEAFVQRGLSTTLVELLPRVMSTMDPEFGGMIARRLEAHGVRVRTGVGIKAIDAGCAAVELSDGSRVPGAVVLVAAGVKAELTLARNAGLALGTAGGLSVDEHMRTSDPFIWAAGDMNEVAHKVSGRTVRVPMAGPANRQGRIAASNALGMSMKYSGALGSSVVKIFDAVAASTGLTEAAASAAGFDAASAIVVKDHHASYYPGGRELVLKLVYDRSSGQLLGGQAFGEEGVEKRIDALATALHGKMDLSDLAEIDFAYSPPFSSANDLLNVAAFAGLNDLSGYAPLLGVEEARKLLAESGAGTDRQRAVLLDVRNLNEYETSHVRGALNIPVDELRFRMDEVPREAPLLVHCRSGFRSHLAVRILKENGWKDVRNITGGYIAMTALGGFEIEE
ncbi:MAG: FAD-dependent oxidoreductase [Spirochaetia bacterium]|jgi:NADPH-dependent 2,4-dienoyl-CoA reductase/sulfur reductase-like enzyme/rhodanese-related sulfurtransferase